MIYPFQLSVRKSEAAPSARQNLPKERVYSLLATKQTLRGLFLRGTALARRHALRGMLIPFPFEFFRKLKWERYNNDIVVR